MTAASGSAGTDVLRHCDLNDLSRTAVESRSNRSCDHIITCDHRMSNHPVDFAAARNDGGWGCNKFSGLTHMDQILSIARYEGNYHSANLAHTISYQIKAMWKRVLLPSPALGITMLGILLWVLLHKISSTLKFCMMSPPYHYQLLPILLYI